MLQQGGRGLCGVAELRFERRRGTTVMTHARLEAPLALVRPFEVAGGGLVVSLTTLGPGMCAGDRSVIDVATGPGTRVVITSTAATRILGMSAPADAVQIVHLDAAAGSSLEYCPAVTIPFPGSAFDQQIEVNAAGDARVSVVELWALGRTARGEYLQFRSMHSRTLLHVDGALRYGDATLLEPACGAVRGAGALDARRYLATGFWLGSGDECPAERTSAPAQRDPLFALGRSWPGLWFLRALADDGQALADAIDAVREDAARSAGLPPVGLDRFRC